ncbi:MAG: 30S ribosomal protein S9 [bacterium]|nr:30S ribosomal protein S9 [bacterium]
MTTDAKKTTKKIEDIKERYFYARGARKTAIARVKLFIKKGPIMVNGKDYKSYFAVPNHQRLITVPLEVVKQDLGATITVTGGGINAQAEAIRHGIARALVQFNETFKKRLRKEGFLTRDPRMVERKKYGLRKARRAPQWAKR